MHTRQAGPVRAALHLTGNELAVTETQSSTKFQYIPGGAAMLVNIGQQSRLWTSRVVTTAPALAQHHPAQHQSNRAVAHARIDDHQVMTVLIASVSEATSH